MADKPGLTAWERWELASFDDTPAAGAATARPSPAAAARAAQDAELAALREKARQEGFAQGREEGRKAGYEVGLAEGRKAGETAGEKLGREQAARFTKAVIGLERQIAQLDDAVADELLALALEVARKVVLDIHDVRPTVVVDVVRSALAQLPLHHAVIQMNPEDASVLRQYAGEQLAHAGHRIQENASLSRGDAILEAAGSHLDATLSARWRRVVDSLGRAHPWVGPGFVAPAAVPAPVDRPPAPRGEDANNDAGSDEPA